jgi:hypothetical protein
VRHAEVRERKISGCFGREAEGREILLVVIEDGTALWGYMV